MHSPSLLEQSQAPIKKSKRWTETAAGATMGMLIGLLGVPFASDRVIEIVSTGIGGVIGGLAGTFWLNRMAIVAITAYQKKISKRLVKEGFRCFHYPSCSNYAILAYQKYPFYFATKRVLERVSECGNLSGRPFIDFP